MAQGNTRKPDRKDSILDLADDLKLLRVSAKDYTEGPSSMEKDRQEKIGKLRKANGTLKEVCFYINQSFCKNCEMKENCYTRVS